MATSEIEKLERRYSENPHGLTFAPLAEIHRKNGDLARALELLTAGLELHPNYIPASIVLGRCHQNLGDLPSAEAAFTHVLRLDDENVIALKSLADINERLERLGEAETWLRRLVSIDRSNDEAREQLRRIETARQGNNGSAAETAAPAPVLEMIDLTPEVGAKDPESSDLPTELLPVDISAMEPSHPAAERSPDHETGSRDSAAEPTPPPAAAVTPDQETHEPEPAREVVAAAEAPTAIEISSPSKAEEPLIQEEAVQPLPGLISAEFQPPLEAIGGLDVETSEEVVLEVSAGSEFRVPDASEDLRSPAAGLPNLTPPTAPAEPERAADPAPEPPAASSYVAADTKGQSVADFFRALVAARPPSDRGSPAEASVADSAVSFDDFFNSEADGPNPQGHGDSDPGKDDLDQFQSWLQNLKR